MNKYLTTKLAEEGAEVALAGCKLLQHQDKPARQDFLGELADVKAMIVIAESQMTAQGRAEFNDQVMARVAREKKKGKAWPKKR